MRLLPRVLIAVSALGCAVVGPAVLAHAAGSGSVTTGPQADGWYRTAPVCALPAGCPEAPSPYSAQSLHVGVNLGQEEARTTLLLDLSALPAGTKPVGGQLRLPILTGPQDGTRNPETAKLRACLVTEPVTDVDGAFAAPPEADCEGASSDAVFVPATAQAPAAFTVDLSALAFAWEDALVPGALTLVPGEVAPPDTWHVAFPDRELKGDGPKVTAAVSFASSSVGDDFEAPAVFAPVDSFGSTDAPAIDTSVSAPGPALDAPVTVAEGPEQPAAAAPAPQAAPPAVVPVAAVVDTAFRYPAVFLLPLLFAAGAAWLGRALTRDLSVS